MKYKLLKKAYKIDFNKIEEGYLSSDLSCVAESRSKAKYKLLKSLNYGGWKLNYSDEEINYLNIPVVREPDEDQFEFENQCISKLKIAQILKERERLAVLQDILLDNSVIYCYIVKHGSYYKSNNSGYTDSTLNAGVYSKYDAVESAKSCQDLILRPININIHNNTIKEKIKDLELNLIELKH